LAFHLNDEGKLRYSPSERLVFDILNRKPSFPLLSTEIISAFYKSKGQPPPYNCRQIVMGSVRSLVRKVELNKEPFKVQRIKEQGIKALSYQLVLK
jgi:hypothetical protein